MNTKVYVDNLAATTTANDVTEIFSAFGNVADVHIAVECENPKPRGFGFVTMDTPEGARAAIDALDGKQIGTYVLTVRDAYPPEVRPVSPLGRRNPRRQTSHLF